MRPPMNVTDLVSFLLKNYFLLLRTVREVVFEVQTSDKSWCSKVEAN